MVNFFKGIFLASAFFERFGLRYIGPVDGHDLKALKAALLVAKNDKRSVLVHVVTTKGKGYPPAEANPVKWHGVSPRAANPAPNAAANATAATSKEPGAVLRDAMLALSALGFSEEIARAKVQQVLAADPSLSDTETILKKALSS